MPNDLGPPPRRWLSNHHGTMINEEYDGELATKAKKEADDLMVMMDLKEEEEEKKEEEEDTDNANKNKKRNADAADDDDDDDDEDDAAMNEDGGTEAGKENPAKKRKKCRTDRPEDVAPPAAAAAPAPAPTNWFRWGSGLGGAAASSDPPAPAAASASASRRPAAASSPAAKKTKAAKRAEAEARAAEWANKRKAKKAAAAGTAASAPAPEPESITGRTSATVRSGNRDRNRRAGGEGGTEADPTANSSTRRGAGANAGGNANGGLHGRSGRYRLPTGAGTVAGNSASAPVRHEPDDEAGSSKYPYLGAALLLGLLLGVGTWWSSFSSSSLLSSYSSPSASGNPALFRDFRRYRLPRCLVDSPDVPASDPARVGDHPGEDAAASANANAGGIGIGPWWTRTPPAASSSMSKSKSADVRGGCADAANPLPCPRHGRCARGFLVDCRADHTTSTGSGSDDDDDDDDDDELFVVSDKSFTECVLSDEAHRIVAAVQDKVIGLTVDKKCDVGCLLLGEWWCPRPIKAGTGDYFSVDALVGAMREEEEGVTIEVIQLLAPHLDGDVVRYIPGSSAAPAPQIGLTTDFMKAELVAHLSFPCWLLTTVREFVLFVLGIIVLIVSSIFRFCRNHPVDAFYIFLAIIVAQHAYLWVERWFIRREARLHVIPLVRKELSRHPQGAAVRQLHIRDDIGQTHHLYAGTGARKYFRRNWMYKKVWRPVKDEIERDRRFRSEKRRTERGTYMEYWVIEFQGGGIGNGGN